MDFVKEILTALYDFPVKSAQFRVDREKEIDKLNKFASLQPTGIFGLCGETGVGKTTVLNFIEPDFGKKFFLTLTEKDSREVIIADLMYKFSSSVMKSEKDKKTLEKAKTIIDFLVNERSETVSVGFEGGFLSAELSKNKSATRKFNIYQMYEYFTELLELLLKDYGRIVLIIDELDKDRKEDVLHILDSLKGVFELKGLIVIISLPFVIYREYTRDRLRFNETGNLENILKDIVFLEPFDERTIQEVILRRLWKYPDYFDGESLEEIAKFSDGNPRDALWIAQQVVLNNLEKERIDGKTTKETIKNFVKKHFSQELEISDIQKQILKHIALNPAARNIIVEELARKGLKRKTVYAYVQKLKELGLLLQKGDVFKVSGRIFYFFSD